MNFKEIELTPVQKKAWEQTRAALVWQAPGFTHVLHTMLAPAEAGEDKMLYWTDDIPTMATDGERIMANPEFFFGLPLFERVFACCHEIGHGIFDHCGTSYKASQAGTVTVGPGKTLPFDSDTANHAQDYVINDVLVQSRIGKINPQWLHDHQIATQNDNWVDAYKKLYDDTKKKKKSDRGGGKGKSSAGGGGQFDQHMQPGTSQGKDPSQAPRKEQQWKNAIAGAAQITKAMGRDSANMLKFFEQFLEPVVDWTDQIQATFARKVGSGSYDFRRPDRRLITRDIYAPGRSGHGAGTVVLAIDTSGSIYAVPNLLERFFAEMSGLLADVKPQRLAVVWCDAQVRRVDWLQDEVDLLDCRVKGVIGGGGTRFEPVFKWVEDEELTPDALVYLTDGFGSFPQQEPPYPVIWGDIQHTVTFPFGDVIKIPNDGSA